MAMGRSVFMVVLTPLTSYALPFFTLIFIKDIFLQKVFGIQFEKYPYRLSRISALVCYLEEFVYKNISLIYWHR